MKMKLPYEMTSTAIKGYSDSAIAKSEDNDCVVRAFASAFEITYDRAHMYVAEKFGRQPKKGTYGTASKLVAMHDNRTTLNYKRVYPVGRRMTDSMFGSLSYDVKVKGITKRRNMTVGTFIKKNAKGTFIVLVSRHAFTIKDGVVIGNYEDAVKTKKIMRCAFEIK
jgi:hypothetical protein